MPDRNRDEQENGGDRNRDSNRRSSNRGTSNPRSPQPNRNRRDDRGTYNRENRGAPRDDRGGYRGTREDRPNTREGQGSYRGNREGRGSYQGNREGQGSSYRGNREGQGGYRGNRDNQSGGYRGTRDDRGGQDRPSYKGNRDDRGGYRNNREGQSSTRDDRPGYNRDRTNDRGGYSGNRDRTNDRGGYSGNRDRTGDRGGYRGNREDRPNTREGQGGYRGNREDRPAYRGARDDRQGSRDNNRGGGYRDREDQGGYRGNRESSSREDRPARESNYRGNNDRGGYRNNRDDRPAYKGNRDDRPSARDDRGGYRGDRDKTRDDRGSYRPSRDRDDRAPRDRNSDRPASREGRPTYRGSQDRTGYQGSRDDRGQERTGYRGNREDRGQERTGFKGNRPNRDDRGGHRGNRDDNRGGYRKDRDDRPTGNDNKTWERGDRYRSTRSDDHAPAEPQTPEPKSGFARKNHYASNTGGEGRTQGYRSRDYEDVTAAPVEPAGSAGEFGITPEQTGQETPADASHADALTATAASTPADNQSTGPGEPNSGIALGAPATTGESNQPGIADGESTTQPEEARAAASVLGEGTATAEPARSDEHRDPAADEPGPEITQAEAAATQRPPATGDSHSTAEPAQPDASEESRRPATAGLGNSDSGADLAQPAGDESGQPATSGHGAASDATLPEAAATEQSTSVGLGNSGATAEPAQPDAQAAVAPEATRSEAAATEQSAPTGPGDSAVEPGQLVAGDESRQQAAPGLDQAGSTAEPAQSSADDQSRQPGLDNSGAAAEPAQPTARDENRQAAASGLGQPSSPAPAQAAANSEAQAATGHSSSGDAVDSSRPAAEGANGESSRPVAAGLGRSDEGGERTSSSYDRPEPRRRDGEPELPDDIQFSDLDPEARRELKSLTKAVAESVGRHLVAAGVLIDEDPELALEHARFARTRASRVAVVREAAGIAAYHAGEWAEALGEFRAVRRMTGSQTHLPVMVDCERALGRPERALELAAEAKDLPTDVAVELKIVTAGARRDLGQLDAAVVGLQGPELDPQKRAPWSARLFYAYADNLAAAGRTDDAIRWFLNAAEADLDEETDAAERATALSAS